MAGRDSGTFFDTNWGVREMVVCPAIPQRGLRVKVCDYPGFLDVIDAICRGHIQRSRPSVPSTKLLPDSHLRSAVSLHRNVLFSIDVEEPYSPVRRLRNVY